MIGPKTSAHIMKTFKVHSGGYQGAKRVFLVTAVVGLDNVTCGVQRIAVCSSHATSVVPDRVGGFYVTVFKEACRGFLHGIRIRGP